MNATASTLIRIPLDQLMPSALNARTIDNASLDELTASIAAEGLLQNLTVTETESGTYEVVAGERRRRAMLALRERGQLPDELIEVPCRLVHNGRAMSASLAENSVREKMHPADELVAFKRLVDEGRTIDEIAHEFGLQPLAVQRHLKLAAVAPDLFELFRHDNIALDQMHALAITDDHDAQRNAWNTLPEYNRDAYSIRRALTKAEINIASDAVARFVGIDAIIAAGGIVRRDLFGGPNDGYTTDRQLIDELALGKLEEAAIAIRAEGWSWVEAAVDATAFMGACNRIWPERNARDLSPDEQMRYEAITQELDILEQRVEIDGQLDHEDEFRAEQLDTQRHALAELRHVWHAEQKEKAGALVTIEEPGCLSVWRGLVRPGNKSAAKNPAPPERNADTKPGSTPTEPASKDLSKPMVMRITAQRTAILQSAIAERPELALVILAHNLLLSVLYNASWERSLSTINLRGAVELDQLAPDLALARHWNAMHDAIKAEQIDFPTGAELFDWLLTQPEERVRRLIGYCVATSIDTVVHNGAEDAGTTRRVRQLAYAAGIDLADTWAPTREAFLAHVPRAVIEQAVLEARDQKAVDSLAAHKKDTLPDAAEQLLAGRRWLPKLLRIPPVKPSVHTAPVGGANPKPATKSKPKAKPSKPNAKKAPAKAPAKKANAKKPASKKAGK